MVIEYSGEVIRASLTDKREKYYEGKVSHIFTVDSIMILTVLNAIFNAKMKKS